MKRNLELNAKDDEIKVIKKQCKIDVDQYKKIVTRKEQEIRKLENYLEWYEDILANRAYQIYTYRSPHRLRRTSLEQYLLIDTTSMFEDHTEKKT